MMLRKPEYSRSKATSVAGMSNAALWMRAGLVILSRDINREKSGRLSCMMISSPSRTVPAGKSAKKANSG